ncbi:MAG: PP2C family protein-serine/threonine phosphatase [Gammaproteobacteria bacterium]|nr:PP2C family protein-serine/threonine phosphatase [Gammaproteobacteria bacterium]
MSELMQAEEESLELRCMEIWGGNRTIEERFQLPGIDAYLSSTAFDGGRGGDLHYLSTCGKGRIVRFLIADVAGHGAKVSNVAMRFKKLLGKHINKLDQSRLAKTLNKEFMIDNEGGRFVTALITSYHRPSGYFVVCNAGHPRPLIYSARTRHWAFLDYTINHQVDDVFNLPLGIIVPTEYRQFAVRLNPGDVVVLYTDGFSDQRNGAQPIGEEGLLEIINGIPFTNPEALVRSIKQALGMNERNYNRIDDETMLVITPTDRAFKPLTLTEQLKVFGRMMPGPWHVGNASPKVPALRRRELANLGTSI